MPRLRRLKGLRVEKRLTQKQMASLIGMPGSSYSRKENGDNQFTLKEAYKISQVLEKTIDEIFFYNSSSQTGTDEV